MPLPNLGNEKNKSWKLNIPNTYSESGRRSSAVRRLFIKIVRSSSDIILTWTVLLKKKCLLYHSEQLLSSNGNLLIFFFGSLINKSWVQRVTSFRMLTSWWDDPVLSSCASLSLGFHCHIFVKYLQLLCRPDLECLESIPFSFKLLKRE